MLVKGAPIEYKGLVNSHVVCESHKGIPHNNNVSSVHWSVSFITTHLRTFPPQRVLAQITWTRYWPVRGGVSNTTPFLIGWDLASENSCYFWISLFYLAQTAIDMIDCQSEWHGTGNCCETNYVPHSMSLIVLFHPGQFNNPCLILHFFAVHFFVLGLFSICCHRSCERNVAHYLSLIKNLFPQSEETHHWTGKVVTLTNFIIACTGNCHLDNLRYSQWR